jgi:APA family basic amino acid/polyamine antiporter
MRWNQLFRTKSLEILLAEMAGEHCLHRALGPMALSALGVGAIIGAGIFVMTGRVAAEDAGPAIVVSFVIAGLGCALAALCYSEFAAMAPIAGSAYTYAYTTLGELFAWVIGWDLILEYAMSCATVAASWTHYFNELLASLGIARIPERLCVDPFTAIDTSGTAHGIVNLPAMLIMAVITTILVLGVRESARTNAVLVLVKLGVVIFVIMVGWHYVNPSNWTSIPIAERIVSDQPAAKWGLLGQLGINNRLTPIDDALRSPFMPYGLSGIMLGASIVFFAYIGFDAISTHAEEARNPQRDLPIGIMSSLVLCTLLYIAVAAVISGMIPYPKIHIEAAVADAFHQKALENESRWLHWATGLIALGGLAGMTSVLLVTFQSQARVFLAMSRDGLLPRVFKQVHPRFRTPHLATMLTGGIICLVAGVTPIRKLAEMVNIGTLMAFVIVCASVLMLRIRRPEAKRPFRCPMVYLVAPLGIGVNLMMALFLPIDTWLRLVIWLAAGLVIYFLYGHWHSVQGIELWRQIQTQGVGPSDAPLPTEDGQQVGRP